MVQSIRDLATETRRELRTIAGLAARGAIDAVAELCRRTLRNSADGARSMAAQLRHRAAYTLRFTR